MQELYQRKGRSPCAPHTCQSRRHPAPTRPAATGSPLFLFVILAAQLMVVLDTTIVNVALPHIQEAFGFSSSDLSWVLNAYILTFGGFLLLGARAGDLYGRRRVFLGGIALFTVSSLLGGLAVERMDVARGSSRAGPRRRTGRAVCAVTAHDGVSRRTRAGPRDRALHDGLCRRRGARSRLRWLAHRAGVVALGHVRQRAHRHRHLGHRPPDHQRIGASSRSLRPRRCGHLDRRHDPHRVRSRRVRVGGLDERADDRLVDRRRDRCSRRSSPPSAGRRNRCCR